MFQKFKRDLAANGEFKPRGNPFYLFDYDVDDFVNAIEEAAEALDSIGPT